jgi:hypothetical protein
MGLSENSVPLHPMVLLIIITTKWLFHWGYTLFSKKSCVENLADAPEVALASSTMACRTAFGRWVFHFQEMLCLGKIGAIANRIVIS